MSRSRLVNYPRECTRTGRRYWFREPAPIGLRSFKSWVRVQDFIRRNLGSSRTDPSSKETNHKPIIQMYQLIFALPTVTAVLHQIVTTPPAVHVQVLSESLCIDCQRFFQQSLIPTYKKLGSSVLALELVPFGNSKLDETKETLACQHGDAECDANSWEQCAVEQVPIDTQLEFFGCLEEALPMGHRDEDFEPKIFKECAEKAEIDFVALQACHDNPLRAWLLQVKYAHLTPDHQYVPWVNVDGKLIDPDKDDFMQEVCLAYRTKGGSHPACASSKSDEEITSD